MASEQEIERLVGVYIIVNTTTHKVYVGSTTLSFRNRWRGHVTQLEGNRHYNGHLQSSWNRYGSDCFSFRVLEVCTPELSLVREQFWIDYYKSWDRRLGYNRRRNASSNLGMKFGPKPEELRRRLSELGKSVGGFFGGRKHSEESKRRISEVQKGKPKPSVSKALTGKKMSEETKAKIAEAHRGKPKPWLLGKSRKFSPETIEKLRIAAKKRGVSDACRKAATKAAKNRIPSPETRRKLSEAAKRQWARVREKSV